MTRRILGPRALGLLLGFVVFGVARAEEPLVLNLANCNYWPLDQDERFARQKAGVPEGASGLVSMRCELNGSGHPKACDILSEVPAGKHLADAAQVLAPKFECRTGHSTGRPLQVEMSYRFNPVVIDDAWRMRELNIENLKPVIPWRAAQARVNGGAVIECGVSRFRALERCEVIAEAPEGLGFGDAVLLVAPGVRVNTPIPAAVLQDVRIRFSVHFPTVASGAYSKDLVEPVVATVYWDETPTRADVAAALGKSGPEVAPARVVFRCGFTGEGRLRDCQVIDAAGRDAAFVDAARALLPKFKMAVGSVDPGMLPKMKTNVAIRQPQDASPPPITKPLWIRTLPADSAAQVFPPKAADAGLKSGTAVLDCVADQHGALSGCGVVRENPAGMDFGVAAQRVARVMGLNAWTLDGDPLDQAHVRFAIQLDNAEPEPAPPASTP